MIPTLSVANRIRLGFGSLLLILALAAADAWYSMQVLIDRIAPVQSATEQTALVLDILGYVGDIETTFIDETSTGFGDVPADFDSLFESLDAAKVLFAGDAIALSSLEAIRSNASLSFARYQEARADEQHDSLGANHLLDFMNHVTLEVKQLARTMAVSGRDASEAIADIVPGIFVEMKLILVSACVFALFTAALLSRSILRPLAEIKILSDSLNAGHIPDTAVDRRSDEFGALARSLHTGAKDRLDAERGRAAMDCSSAMVMLANNDHEIVFLNETLVELFKKREHEIKSDLPHFEAASLVGRKIDVFHKNPVHQRGMVEALSRNDSAEARINVGGVTFNLSVRPAFGRNGGRIGTVVEWRDLTQELILQNEIANVVSAAVDGDFTKRADMSLATGVLREIGERVNDLAETVDASLSECKSAVSLVAAGDLTASMDGAHRGVFADLQSDLNTMISNLRELVARIQRTATDIGDVSRTISDGANQLSTSADSQAASVEETTATMEGLTSTVKANNESAEAVRCLASDASARARAGREVVGEAMTAMHQLSESSSRISDIVSIIDGIAFQTNLLALNAAVEAARAGEAGKGFAVVASEVRGLAQRSSDAAKDISGLISESGSYVSDGVQLVNKTGDSLSALFDAVNEVSSRIGEISEACAEQASSVLEVSKVVVHVDKLTQQNSALAEQSASAARDLVDRGGVLIEASSRFKLCDDSEKRADADWGRAHPVSA